MPKQQKKSVPLRDSAVTILTSGCHFNGKLYCRGSSRIGGRIEGEIISEGLLIIEEAAIITAEIQADEAIIQGTVKGKLKASGRVELAATSRFEGDISTPSLMVSEGAQFNGRSFMEAAAEKSNGKYLEALPSNELDGPDATPDFSRFDDAKQPDVAMIKFDEPLPVI
jgi:cytoskeletal protein CcmA (bactofilin family)